MRAVIFVGPSLPPRLRPSGPLWEWRPPVRQGDVYRAALTRPDAIGIIDGYFETVPTVWHKEILWAMAEGIPVFGAASIGALRAAELDSFGMIGVGHIYEDFRDGILQDDDEVAVLHGPAELGYPAITEAMVNIRATLAAAVTAGILSSEEAAALTASAKGLFYKKRTWEMISGQAQAHAGVERTVHAILPWIRGNKVDWKYNDAETMLASLQRRTNFARHSATPEFNFMKTVVWRAFVNQTERKDAVR